MSVKVNSRKMSPKGGPGDDDGWKDKKLLDSSPNHSMLSEWCALVSDYSSLHGVPWYNRMDNVALKTVLFFLIMLIVIGLPVVVVYAFIAFLNDDSMTDAVLWTNAKAMRYPNITICNAGFFDQKRMEENGVSTELANYMTLVFDPAAPNLLQYHKANGNTAVVTKYEQLEEELDTILQEKDLDLLELMVKIAVKCEEVVTYCEIHKQLFPTIPGTPDDLNCCRTLLDPRPFFTLHGTCFVAAKRGHESFPYTWSSVEFWLNFDQLQTPVFDLSLKGSDAIERGGLLYSIANRDHPMLTLNTRQFKVIPGMLTTVALSIRLISRENLSEGLCLKDFPESSEFNGVAPYTKLNCEAITSNGKLADDLGCSFMKYNYISVESDKDRKPCLPKDVLKTPPFDFNATAIEDPDAAVLETSEEDEEVCKFECSRVEYLTKQTFAAIHPPQLDSLNLTVETTAVLQFYFESFDYEKHTLTQETFADFFSKVGGWIGLLVGASLISFLEIIYFIILLFRAGFRATRHSKTINVAEK